VKLLVNEIRDTWLQITDTYDLFSEIETLTSCEQMPVKPTKICRGVRGAGVEKA
jgi:hypothetical protein